jgi:uncharacterized membrane protein
MFKLTRTLIRHHRQIAVLTSLLFATAVCAALLVVRIAQARGLTHLSLAWNLVLAWLPFLCSLAAYNLHKQRTSLSWLMIAASTFVWLLFFPNAPYMVTDLLHLYPRQSAHVPLWYDLILIVAFAWTSFFLGLVSLYLMQTLVRRMAGALASWAFAVGVLVMSAFGVYLGRFLRWNSWDIFLSPRSLLADVWDMLRHPLANFHTFVFSALFSAFIISTYLIVIAVTHLHPESQQD